MKKLIPLLFLSFFVTSYSHASEGVTSVASHHSVKETADRFVDILSKKGLTLFARIDHQKNAKSVNLELRETEVLIFGNPKVGTPLMQCEQQVAIDLPQKVLIAKDADGNVWLSYNDPEYIKQRHQVTGCDAVFSKVANVLSALTNAAAK
ncbi:DUF302 domain-containing protein [Psychromonas sp. 14N.309.X.WAT.B.A12]|uniref:DUF302 domain-containing protein n=1 Tax=unclassified Psychromonas TaxID=2614957 RepID=UPI0025B0AC13|nr:DUF302 domain-containing protein [Psychromonas sp. 14N.309.X.WAT.B.A12]MDN2664236.1 DUF302 domain-containing protein [Psychromonas sp. 14N.309.X.WAT.B.A12]